MRTVKSFCDTSANAQLISQALTVQIRTEYDVAQPYPANIETLLQRLVCQEIDRETAGERDRIWKLSQDLLMVTDLNGKVVDINPAWSATLGWSADDMVGDTAEWLIHPDDRDRSFRDFVNEAAANSAPCASCIRMALIACSPCSQCAIANSSMQAPGTSPI